MKKADLYAAVLDYFGKTMPPSDTELHYDSPFQKGVSLVFVVNHASRYVEDVLLISAPIQNLQDPMARYGLQS